MQQFVELIGKHPGARVCVMGGGPTLQRDIENVEADVWISVNGHGGTHDYVVAMDDVHGDLGVSMLEHIRARSAAPIIGPNLWNDYVLHTWPGYPATNVLSGMIAAWVAWAMGAKLVILAGMDGYNGSRLEYCRPIVRDVKCSVRIAGGGPLTRFWPEFDPAEIFEGHIMHPSIDALKGKDGLTRIRCIKRCSTPSLAMEPGQEATVMRHQVLHWLEHRLVEEVPMPAPKEEKQPEAAPKRRGRPPKVEE